MLPKTTLFLARRTHERLPTKALSPEPCAGLFLCVDLKKRLCGRHLGVANAKKTKRAFSYLQPLRGCFLHKQEKF